MCLDHNDYTETLNYFLNIVVTIIIYNIDI